MQHKLTPVGPMSAWMRERTRIAVNLATQIMREQGRVGGFPTIANYTRWLDAQDTEARREFLALVRAKREE